MSHDLFSTAQTLTQLGLNRAALDVLQRLVETDPDLPEAWKLLLQVADSSSQRISAVKQLCRLQPDDAHWQAVLIALPPQPDTNENIEQFAAGNLPSVNVSNAPPPVSQVPGKSRPSLGTRIAVWAAILSMMATFSTVYFQAANELTLEKYDRPIDLFWFARRSEEAGESETPEMTQQVASIHDKVLMYQQFTDSLSQQVRVQNAILNDVSKNVSETKVLIEQSRLSQDRQTTQTVDTAVDRIEKELKALSNRVESLRSTQPRSTNPFWEWYWRDLSKTRINAPAFGPTAP